MASEKSYIAILYSPVKNERVYFYYGSSSSVKEKVGVVGYLVFAAVVQLVVFGVMSAWATRLHYFDKRFEDLREECRMVVELTPTIKKIRR